MVTDGVADLESRPYWERVWTIQESNMNPSCFILCGSSKPLHCQILFWALPILNLLNEDYHGEDFSSEVCELHMLRHDSRLHSGSRSNQGNYLLRRLCNNKATDEVDRIFAVKAFSPETFDMVMIDYSQTTIKVYTDAARSLLEAHHDGRFMRFASHSGRNDELPTWVPAWTPTHKHRWIWGITATRQLLYQRALVAKEADGNVLRIKGLRVDSLTATISDPIPKLFPIGMEQKDYAFNDLSTTQAACAVFKAWVEKLGAMSNGEVYTNRLDGMVNRISFRFPFSNT